jgi:hypothetical protein
MLKGIDDLSATGCDNLIPLFIMGLAQVYGKAGKPEEGLNRLVEAKTTREWRSIGCGGYYCCR